MVVAQNLVLAVVLGGVSTVQVLVVALYFIQVLSDELPSFNPVFTYPSPLIAKPAEKEKVCGADVFWSGIGYVIVFITT